MVSDCGKIFYKLGTSYSDRTHTAFQEAFQEDLKYSDFFGDHLPQHIGDVRRELIFYGLETGLEKADLDRTTSTCTTELNTYKGTKEHLVI